MTGFVHQTLADLFSQAALKVLNPEEVPPVLITGITYDSRMVEAGYLYVAQVGGTVDGHQYIPHAIRNGAAAVVGTQALGPLPGSLYSSQRQPDGAGAAFGGFL